MSHNQGLMRKTPTSSLPHNHQTIQLSNNPFRAAGPLELVLVQGFKKWYARPVTLRIQALIQCDSAYKADGSL